jgi:hypothetical protein
MKDVPLSASPMIMSAPGVVPKTLHGISQLLIMKSQLKYPEVSHVRTMLHVPNALT